MSRSLSSILINHCPSSVLNGLKSSVPFVKAPDGFIVKEMTMGESDSMGFDTQFIEHQTEISGFLSDEDDVDAFQAVFPCESDLVKQHELYPIVALLGRLIAQPSELFVHLINDSTFKLQTMKMLQSKLRSYEQTRLLHANISVQHVLEAIQKRVYSKPQLKHDGWVNYDMITNINIALIKTALYYIAMWRYLSMISIDITHYVESIVDDAAVQWKDNIVQEMSLSPLWEGKMLETTLRPLRLRGHNQSPDCTVSNTFLSNFSKDLSLASANTRRVRLARQSNEFMIAWFLAHKSNPYPSGAERIQIAQKTGLSEQQVRNWFANMRKRHWKPKASSKTPRSLLDVLLRQEGEEE